MAHDGSSRGGAVAGTRQKMRAIAQDGYGSLDRLELREIDRPEVGDGEVLVRVHAAALHIGDCFAVRGEPYLMRMATGVFRPTSPVPGFDLAGTVEAVGRGVTRFRPGDEVFGSCPADGRGTCAEFSKLKEDFLAPKPENLTLEQAAALATSGIAALCGVRDAAKVRAGQRVLIIGASGGVGTFGVQIAKSYGAEVTAVCSAANADMVRSLGADRVIDYAREDFAEERGRYDVILDNVENRSLSDCRKALSPEGTLVLNSGTGASGMAMMVRLLKPILLSPFVRQNLRRYISGPNYADLTALKQLVETGKVRPEIGKTFSLAETTAALRYIESGHARGKVIVTIRG
ncbi:MAG: NAD(P)-dependent alcohol dehydrogenase [Polyangiaceae bacterium]